MSDPNIVATIDATFENQTELNATLSTDNVVSADFGLMYGGGECKVLYNTTEFWNSHPAIIAKEGYLYVYSDYKQDGENKNLAGIKAGDGTSYLIDMPFIDELYADHIDDVVKHITAEERTFWNNKVRCYIDPENTKNIVFTTQ